MAPAGMTGLGDRGDCALSEAPNGQNGARGLVNGSIFSDPVPDPGARQDGCSADGNFCFKCHIGR